MIDIAILRENPEAVKENMRKKFQHDRLHLVDEAYALDKEYREALTKASELRAMRNSLSKEIGQFRREGKKDLAEENKRKVSEMADTLKELEAKEIELGPKLTLLMIVYLLEKMTVKTLKFKNMEILLFLIMKSHIMRILLQN